MGCGSTYLHEQRQKKEQPTDSAEELKDAASLPLSPQSKYNIPK